MPLTGIYGFVGSGKNVVEVADCVYTPKNIPIYTNFRMDLPNVKKIEPEDVFDLFEVTEENPVIKLVTDEAYSWFESRGSGFNELNRFLSYLMFQSRKRGLNWISIAQLRGTLDLRWRGLEDKIIVAKARNLDSAGNSTDNFNYILLKNLKKIQFGLEYEKAKKFFPLYDTKQVILPPDFQELKDKLQFKKNPKLLNDLIDKIVTDLFITKDSFPCKTLKSGEVKYGITQDWVADKLLRINPKWIEYTKYVTVRLKAHLLTEEIED